MINFDEILRKNRIPISTLKGLRAGSDNKTSYEHLINAMKEVYNQALDDVIEKGELFTFEQFSGRIVNVNALQKMKITENNCINK